MVHPPRGNVEVQVSAARRLLQRAAEAFAEAEEQQLADAEVLPLAEELIRRRLLFHRSLTRLGLRVAAEYEGWLMRDEALLAVETTFPDRSAPDMPDMLAGEVSFPEPAA